MDGQTHRNMKAAGGPDHESYSRMESEEMAPKPKDEAGWEVDRVELRRTENDGIIVTCSKSKKLQGKDRQMGMRREFESKDYAFSGMDEALEFARAELAGSTSSGTSGPGTTAMAMGPRG